MIKDLEKVAEIFLNDVDAEDFQENLKTLSDWEKSLDENRLFLSWQNHDITKDISRIAKESFKSFAMQLMQNRTLTEQQRFSLWAKQDACLFILELTEKDAKQQIQQILKEVHIAINTFM